MKKHNLKRVAIYGDSISTRNHGNGGYEEGLKTSLKLDRIDNYAIGSSGLSMTTPNSMVGLIQDPGNVPKDVELFLIWHGTNDWYWGTEIGAIGDTNSSTFWGGIDTVVHVLRRTAPKAMLAWVTPIYRFEKPNKGSKEGDAYTLPNSVGYTLLDYYEALELASKRYGFYLIDMRRKANIHPYNADDYLEDQVHPNEKGYQAIHQVLHNEIINLMNEVR